VLNPFARRARGPADAGHGTQAVAVTLYTRAGCGCCRTALGVLEAERRRGGMTLELVDVDADSRLAEAYGAFVPVVAVGGKVRFRGVVNPVLLRRLIEAGAGGLRPAGHAG